MRCGPQARGGRRKHADGTLTHSRLVPRPLKPKMVRLFKACIAVDVPLSDAQMYREQDMTAILLTA